MKPPHRARASRWAAWASAVALGACAGRAQPPEPGSSQGSVPDLRGFRVMVLPVQQNEGVTGEPDAELAFGLQDRGESVAWVMPPRLEEILARTPGLDTRIRGLAVGAFASAEVRRVGDPLFGELRRLGALADAELAVLPVSAQAVRLGGLGTAVRLSVAIVHVRTGRVLWFGVVEGDPHAVDDPRGLASAVDALARTLLWFTTG